ncbi:MAG: acyltransferase [Cystobacterineae bacterium]|nr:acyltransferase [Cystobacterineae bacterium]
MKNAFRGHIPALDGVRGLAIGLVLAVHLFSNLMPGGGFFHNALKQLLSYGALGVEVFFVLSGFLITGILYDTKTKAHFFKNFYMRRFLRIFPLYYGVLALIALVAFGLPQWVALEPQTLKEMHNLQGIQGWLWSYGLNFYIWLRHITDWAQLPYVSHFWSLCVEEHFYMFWPIVVFCLPRKPLIGVAMGLVAFSMFMRMGMYFAELNPLAIYALTFCRFDALCLGGILALVVRSNHSAEHHLRWMRKAALWLLGIGALFVLLSFLLTWGQKDTPLWNFFRPLRETAFNVVFAGILAGALVAKPHSLVAGFFCSTFMRFLGRYSYGLYVYHAMLAYYFVSRNTLEFVQQWVPHALAATLLLGSLGCALSCAMAVLSYHIFEKHFLKLKSFFEAKPDKAPKAN